MTRDETPSTEDLVLRLLDEHGDALYRYLLVILGRVEDAEDTYQLLWSRVLSRVSKLRNPEAYLWRSARNEARRCLRRRNHFWAHQAEPLALETFPNRENPGVPLTTRIALDKALRTLPVAQQEAVALMGFEGMTAREAGMKLSCSPNTVSARYRRALIALRGRLGRQESDDG